MGGEFGGPSLIQHWRRLGFDLAIGLRDGQQADVAGPELRRSPEFTALAADWFGVLKGVAQLGAVQGSPVAFGKAAVDFSELEVGLGAQVAGLALLHHRDIAAGERREAHLAAPALSGVLGPAVALPPDAEHAAKGSPCRCVTFFVGLDDVAHGTSGFY